jgi:large subunit ribosomal protein L22
VPGVKTNETLGTRAVLRHYRMSAYKARPVLDLVRGQDVERAREILRSSEREGARVVAKVLDSAVANARNNDLLDPEDLYVSACYADEGTTLKRWRPRARGRATRIRKRTCHITVIVSRLPDERLARQRSRREETVSALRSRRVAASRRGAQDTAETAVPGTTRLDDDGTTTEVGDTGLDDSDVEDLQPEDGELDGTDVDETELEDIDDEDTDVEDIDDEDTDVEDTDVDDDALDEAGLESTSADETEAAEREGDGEDAAESEKD